MREITDVKEIQQIGLQILIFVDKVCRENNLKYVLAYGTALGAVRHHGFIPWDDDIDIAMPRPDYEKFLKIMDEKYSDGRYKCLYFSPKRPTYIYTYAKVCDTNTVLYETNFKKEKDLGAFIDVFPLDGISESNIKPYKKSVTYGNMSFVSGNVKYVKSKYGFLRNILKFLGYCVTRITGNKPWLKKCQKIVDKQDYNAFDKCIVYSLGGYGVHEILDKSIYEDRIEIEFEKHKFFISKDYDKYLTQIYGDYMQLPPEEKRVTHHFFTLYEK